MCASRFHILLSKAHAIDTVVDILVYPVVGDIDLELATNGIDVRAVSLIRDQMIEGTIHHPQDMCALVADNLPSLDVVQRG